MAIPDMNLMEQVLASIDTPELTDAQKCGHVLEFLKQQKFIRNVAYDPRSVYVMDGNAMKNSSINMRAAERVD
jgi:hypothetical protein